METLSNESKVKARKEHCCNFCSEKISIGQPYYSSTHVNDGDIYAWRTHVECRDLSIILKMQENCPDGVGQFEFEEIVHEAYYDLMAAAIPEPYRANCSVILDELPHVKFQHKLRRLIRHYSDNPVVA